MYTPIIQAVLTKGEVDGVAYLLMSKVGGRSLSNDWIGLSERDRESAIEQIVEQARIFHSIRFDRYALPRPREYARWEEAVDAYTSWDGIDLSSFDQTSRVRLNDIRIFYQENKHLLGAASEPVLVHNDLHFENILHTDGHVTGIVDFDFARQAPREYELRQLLDFFCSPAYFVEERLEGVWRTFHVRSEIRHFQKYYPELFDVDDLVTRLKLYITESIVSDLRAGAVSKFNERYRKYFEGHWLEQQVY